VREAPRLDWLITAFTQRVPDVARAAVVSADGLPLACSHGFPPDGLDQLAAIASGLSSLVPGAARIFDEGSVVQTVVMMQQAGVRRGRSGRVCGELGQGACQRHAARWRQ
jgi:hypothetical protein